MPEDTRVPHIDSSNDLDTPRRPTGKVHLDQRLFDRRLAALVALKDRHLYGSFLGHLAKRVEILRHSCPVQLRVRQEMPTQKNINPRR